MNFINKKSLGIVILIIGILSGTLFTNKQNIDINKEYSIELSDYNIEIVKMQEYKQSSDDEDFTEEELDNMQYVDNKIQDLMKNEKYNQLSFEDRKDVMEVLLNELEENGYIKYIYYDEDGRFTFSYYIGILGGVIIKEFDPMLN